MWSLGVIIYQLAHDFKEPFEDPYHDDEQTRTNVISLNYSIDSHVSRNIKTLIKMLIVKDQTKRATPENILGNSVPII